MDPIFGSKVARVLAEVPSKLEALALAEWLRKRLPGELARRAAALHILRLRSLTRFDGDFLPYLNAKGLEQATPQAVAEARARQIAAKLGNAACWDATCGIGADSVALLRAGVRLLSSDLDPENCRFTRANLEAQAGRGRLGSDRRAWTLRADATGAAVRADLVLLDPDRRAGGNRSLDPRTWSPSLEVALEVGLGRAGACLKLAPGLDLERLGPVLEPLARARIAVSWEWTSWRGSLCELTLWLGALAREGDRGHLRHVCAIDREGGEQRVSGEPTSCAALEAGGLCELRYLAEPDPALIRSGLLGWLAQRSGMAPIAPRCAYLGGSEPASSKLLHCWKILGSTTLDRKRVRALLGEHDIGPITVKKRGHPNSAEELEARFRGPGREPGLLAVARLEQGHIAFLLEPPPGGAGWLASRPGTPRTPRTPGA